MKTISSKMLQIAKTAYDIPRSKTLDDFRKDFARLKYIKRLINKFKKHNTLNERLLINHLILWFNTFNTRFAVNMLLEEVTESDYDVLFPLLAYISYLPNDIGYDNIVWNLDIIKRLNEL